jgi:hypothetical protein
MVPRDQCLPQYAGGLLALQGSTIAGFGTMSDSEFGPVAGCVPVLGCGVLDLVVSACA